MPGTLAIVATPIGNLEDITLRALRVLREASVIAAEDTRRTARLLAHFDIATPTVSLHDHNERERVPRLIDRVRAGETVAVVTDAGTPAISDPGYLIVRSALEAGVKVEVVPGVSALTTALVGSGLPVDRVTFVGFAPARSGERGRWLADLKALPGSIVLFDAPTRLRATLQAALEVLGDRQVAVAHELTKLHESWHRGQLSQVVYDVGLPGKGEMTVVLGPPEPGRPATSGDRPLSPREAGDEFGHLTKSGGLSRRDAIAELARRHTLPRRVVYSLVEQAKNKGE